MVVFGLTILLICVRSSIQFQDYFGQKFSSQYNAFRAPRRIILLMEQYVHEAEQRAGEMHEMRFMYEESPHYELGYVFHEVVDRYRKMVWHVRRPMEFQADNVFMTLKHTESIQNLYFDIYHLVHMMHEIYLKYAYMPEFQNLGADIDVQKVLEEQQAMKEKDRLESRDRKKTERFYKKMQELASAQGGKLEMAQKKKQNKLWPIDYGWELEDWW